MQLGVERCYPIGNCGLANTHCSFVVTEPQTHAYSQFNTIHTYSFTSYIILLTLLIHSFSKYPRISQAFKTVCLKLRYSYHLPIRQLPIFEIARTFILWIHVRKPCKVGKMEDGVNGRNVVAMLKCAMLFMYTPKKAQTIKYQRLFQHTFGTHP